MSTDVKFFHSGMLGAPVLTGQPGAEIALLDAVLKDGFGLKSIASLTVADGIAVANFSSGHSFSAHTVVLIAGATQAALNGEKRILTATATKIMFAAAGVVDQTAEGAMTAKVAPLGWQKVFVGADVAVYQSSDPLSSGMYLRINDTDTKNARVVGYEFMSDINTGIKPFPADVQSAGGYYWPKSSTADAAPRTWCVCGDTRGFYLCVNPGAVQVHSIITFFGDPICNKSGDAYSTVLHGLSADYTDYAAPVQQCVGYSSKASGHGAVARSANALGGAQLTLHVGTMHMGADAYSGAENYSLIDYPNKSDNGLLFCKVAEIDNAGLRSTLPGFFHVPQSKAHQAFTRLDVEQSTGDLNGHAMLALRPGAPSGTSYGVVFFDVTGPWR